MPARKGTQCVHAGTSDQPYVAGITTPIFTSTSFLFSEDEDEVVYPRYYNVPTQQVVASRIAQLENAEQGLVLSSGMAAIVSVLLALLKQGDHALFHSGVYGGTRSFVSQRLPSCGIEYSLIRSCDVSSFEKHLQENTKLIFFESPTNPLLHIIDIEQLADLARRRGILTVIDNTFATPINQNPLDLGVDVVIHSGTKYLNGHSDVNCGAIATSRNLMGPILECAVQLGGTLDVRACYLLERGLKTLALRVQRQCENAEELVDALSGHRRVRQLYYPGKATHPGHAVAARQMARFGGMFSIELDTDAETAKEMLRRLKIVRMAVSLGGVESLVCFPKDTSHAKMTAEERSQEGITDTLIRVSVGIEDSDDLRNDFEQALQ